MKIFVLFFSFLLIATNSDRAISQTQSLSAQQPLSLEELQKIQKGIQLSKYLTLDFDQVSISGLRGHKTSRKGKAYFLSPDKFSWMLETPVREYKIFDGSAFYDYSPDQAKAIRHAPQGKQVEQLLQIVEVVMKFDSLLQNYHLVSAYRDNFVYIKLKPKKNSEIKEISLVLDEKTATVTNVTLEMANKNKLIHEFKNPSKTPFSLSIFQIPPKVQISSGL
jgi:outer membrane lipoprotein-sorting protein